MSGTLQALLLLACALHASAYPGTLARKHAQPQALIAVEVAIHADGTVQQGAQSAKMKCPSPPRRVPSQPASKFVSAMAPSLEDQVSSSASLEDQVSSSASGGVADVTIHVKDARLDDTTPVSGAKVTGINGVTCTADATGTCTLKRMTTGTETISVEKPGFAPAKKTIPIPYPGNEAKVSIIKPLPKENDFMFVLTWAYRKKAQGKIPENLDMIMAYVPEGSSIAAEKDRKVDSHHTGCWVSYDVPYAGTKDDCVKSECPSRNGKPTTMQFSGEHKEPLETIVLEHPEFAVGGGKFVLAVDNWDGDREGSTVLGSLAHVAAYKKGTLMLEISVTDAAADSIQGQVWTVLSVDKNGKVQACRDPACTKGFVIKKTNPTLGGDKEPIPSTVSSCGIWGDPHFVTFDQSSSGATAYVDQLRPSMDVWLVKNDKHGIEMQLRGFNTHHHNRLTKGVAISGSFMAGHKLILNLYPTTQYTFDGGAMFPNGKTVFENTDAQVTCKFDKNLYHQSQYNGWLSPHMNSWSTNKMIHCTLAKGVSVAFIPMPGSWAGIQVRMPKWDGSFQGWCGNFNGNVNDDKPPCDGSNNAASCPFPYGKASPNLFGDNKNNALLEVDDGKPETADEKCGDKVSDTVAEKCKSLDDQAAQEECELDICRTICPVVYGKAENDCKMPLGSADPMNTTCVMDVCYTGRDLGEGDEHSA